MIRTAIHLHLHYQDVAIELIERVAALTRPPPLFVTYSAPLSGEVDRALGAFDAPTVIRVPNIGWDIGPLLHILPALRDAGVTAVAHLHTKKGNSGYAAEWRALGLDGTVGDDAVVAAIGAAFHDPAIRLAGSARLWTSAAAHMFGNGEALAALAPTVAAPGYPPADWGFFAGSFFWSRVDLLERLVPLATFEAGDARDGTAAHALERLIGLAGTANGGRVALVAGRALRVVGATDAPPITTIVETLADSARDRNFGPPDAALSSLIARHNPLVDYIRRGRDADALDPNPHFSTSFYRRVSPDVVASGCHPLQHYIAHGAREGRMTGPLFDGAFYRARFDDVTGDPLVHFLTVGADERRVAIPVSQPHYDAPDGGLARFYPTFDLAAERRFLDRIAARPAADDVMVSVIMPAWNRAATIGAAIRSVLAQTHRNFELIIVDDGSTDDTRGIVEPFLADPRVRLIEGAHRGVSAARNLGLAQAKGRFVAYLDSDNRWTAWFLDVMVRYLVTERLDAGYSAIALRDDLTHLTGYRGAPFFWEACLAQNYVDLNAFVHTRDVLDQVGTFDETLRRMVDWDLILRIGRDRRVGYAPFVGCDYSDGKATSGRITVDEPLAFRKVVEAKNRHRLSTDDPALAAHLQLSFAIKVAAPYDERANWGDWHFAESLAEAIRRLGHVAEIDGRNDWFRRPVAQEDVAITLRGLVPAVKRPGQLSILWSISHPDQTPFAELDAADLVYAASASHAASLRHQVTTPVATLLQATDPTRFHPVATADGDAPDLLFVGNSRGVEREIVTWAIAAGRPPVIYGNGWDGRVDPALVVAPSIDNRALGPLYATAGVVLNDHWPSMRAFGYLSNRLFDIVAAGGRAVSDAVPSMTAVFGEAVAQVDGPAALGTAVERQLATPRDTALAGRIADAHGFDARAARIVRDSLALLGVGMLTRDAPAGLRVHLIAHHGPHGVQSSAHVRLIAPLTDESVSGRVALTVAPADAPVPPCDVCIVQRTALPSLAAAEALIADLAARGVPLVTDVDDGFRLIGDDHPEAAVYRPLSAALDRLVAASAESWFSTAPLADAYAGLTRVPVVQANALDPRLWRDWRRTRDPGPGDGTARLLYMGTATHGADFAMIRPALDALWALRQDFSVTLVGVAADVAPAPWLARLSPPAEAIAYPRFARWLRDQGPFDIGLAPLTDTPFNRAKSDVKLLDYAAIGMAALASDVPAYRADAGAGAVLTDDWTVALAAMIDDAEGTRARAAAATAHLWSARTVSGVAPAMVARLEALVR